MSQFIQIGFSNAGLATKYSVHFFLYVRTILVLGTDKHRHWVERGLQFKDFGCFGLTEIAHGSNVQGILTKATYDQENDEFIINTPMERGMKFWIGNAAHTANMCVVFANLIVHGKDYGIHIFVVPIRDAHTNRVLAGVVIGDCGDKLGHKVVDNGYILFRNVKVPRDALLDKVTQVNNKGEVTSLFKKKQKRFAVQLSALSEGRVKISLVSAFLSSVSARIPIRFATVRRQFGKDKYDEQRIIDYPSW